MENINNTAFLGRTGGLSLNRIIYFVAIAETGSFTGAAERLGITKAVVSQQITRLEADLRAALLIRTTRYVRMTEAGQQFYLRCSQILREAEHAFSEASASASEPAGTLRLTAPHDYGTSIIVPVITKFSARYPYCKIEAHFSDEIQTLNASHYDLAIRVGWITDQHLQIRRLGYFSQKLVAAAQWHPWQEATASSPASSAIPFIANTALSEPETLDLTNATGHPERITMKATLFLNTTLAVREAVLAGAGMAILPDYVVSEYLSSGELFDVLPHKPLPEGQICVVYPTTRYRPANVRAFVDLLLAQTSI